MKSATDDRLSLEDFMTEYAVWDPMPLWDGRRYLLYMLVMDRSRGLSLGNFFTNENEIHVFESHDLCRWRHLGVAFQPSNRRERLCAGNAVLHAGRYWFFGSSTVEQLDDQHLDQRLFLAVSNDGVRFERVPDFHLEPDASIYPHASFHPDDGRMLFAWRDPWPWIDPASGKIYLYICTGGERWGVPSNVAVACADHVEGPYRVLGMALDPAVAAQDRDRPIFGEIERVNVIRHGGRFHLTFSCWKRLVDEVGIERCGQSPAALSDHTVYVMVSDSPQGPFGISRDVNPVVAGSHAGGFYGTTFFADQSGDLATIGWDSRSFRIETSRMAKLKFSPSSDGQSWVLRLYRPPWRLLTQLLGRVRRVVVRSIRRFVGAAPRPFAQQ